MHIPLNIRALVLILTLISAAFAEAQVNGRMLGQLEIPLDQISLNEGLSQGMVFGVAEDADGFLWIATKDGLNRYDGTGCKIFRHEPHNPYSLPENYITAVYVDRWNHLWIGTNSSGVFLFDPSLNRFIPVRDQADPDARLSSKSVNQIMEDRDGNLVIGNSLSAGMNAVTITPSRADGDPRFFSIMPLQRKYPGIPDSILVEGWLLIGIAADGTLWGVKNNVVFGFTPEALEGHQAMLMFNSSNSAMDAGVFKNNFFFDPDRQNLYVATSGNRILRYDPSARNFITACKIPDDYIIDIMESPFHSTFFVDDENNLWLHKPRSPGLRINLGSGDAYVLNFNWEGTEEEVRSNPLAFVWQDKNQNLYSTAGGYGLLKISSRMNQFTRLPELNSRFVQAIEAKVVRDEPDIRKAWAECIAVLGKEWIIQYHVVTVDTAGFFWCRADSKSNMNVEAIFRIDPRDCSYTMIRKSRASAAGFIGAPIFEDRHGTIWYGEKLSNQPFRLVRLFGGSFSEEKYDFPVEVIENEHQFISDWYIDEHDIFWLGTKQGLFAFDPKQSKWVQHFQHHMDEPESLSGDYILSLCPDPANSERYLWIGTDGSGMNKLDFTTGRFEHFSAPQQLPNNVIYAILSDNHKNLWISTNSGLCQFNPTTNEARTFTSKDGLPGNEFNRFAAGKTKSGTMCFGGPSGAVMFDPEVFYEPHPPSAIVFNEFRLFNKELFYSYDTSRTASKSFKLPAPITVCRELIFRHHESMITLGFVVLDLTNPDGNRYRFMMEGFNEDWIDAGHLHEATYTNLDPGRYTFKVIGCNSSNVWSTKPASISIVVLPPWWKTWWFRGLLICFVAAAGYAFYRYRLKQALRLQVLRNQIATDLHDEIGSTLSSISLASSVITRKLDDRVPDISSLVTRISKNTDDMMEAMSDIVWAVNSRNDRFDNVLNRMRAFAIEMLEPSGTQLHFNSDPSLQHIHLDMRQRKNLYLVFKEAIHNAAKYASCRNVYVNMKMKHGVFHLQVNDDGVGFGQAEPVLQEMPPGPEARAYKMGGNGVTNMHKRATELRGLVSVRSTPGRGTTVEMSFPV